MHKYNLKLSKNPSSNIKPAKATNFPILWLGISNKYWITYSNSIIYRNESNTVKVKVWNPPPIFKKKQNKTKKEK